MYKFPIVIKTEFDLSNIYPIMQRHVDHIIRVLPATVEEMIVFGSSVTLRCGEESDLDILIITEEDKHKLLKELSTVCRGLQVDIDFVIKSKEEFKQETEASTQNISKEAFERGVKVYERTLSTC